MPSVFFCPFFGAKGHSFVVTERPAIHSYGKRNNPTISKNRNDLNHINYLNYFAIPLLSGLFCMVSTQEKISVVQHVV